jgi:hypothetical protein
VLEATETRAATPAASPAATPAEPVKTPAEEPKHGTTVPVEGQPAAPTEPQIEEEPNLEEAPESSGDFSKYKPLFKDNPELRNIIGREKAFSELGNFSDVREIVSRIPTIEDAEALTEQAENAKTFGETFRSDRTSFVESLKESDPLAFQALAAELPDILAQTDEKLYAEQARSYTNRVLSNTLAIAQQSGDAKFLEAVQIVAQYLSVQPGSAPRSADNSEASRLRKQLAERDQNDANQAFESFWGATDEAIISSATQEVESTVKKALPNATQKQLDRINQEVWTKTLATLNAQPQFRQQIESYKAAAQKGRVGVADHKTIVDFGTRRAKLVIPKVAKEVISEWSKEVLQLSSETITKKKDIADKTKDAGSGPQGTTSAAAASINGNAKPRGLSNIFSEIESGTYAKR